MPESVALGVYEVSSASDAQTNIDNCSNTADESVLLSRKRKQHVVEDGSGKRSKDTSGRRTPLRVVPDSETNRQTSSILVSSKGGKLGFAQAEKENDCDTVSECCNVSSDVPPIAAPSTADRCSEIDAPEVQLPPVGESHTLLLSRETLDRNVCEETDSCQTDEEGAQAFHFPDCCQPLQLLHQSGSDELPGWHEVVRPGVWQIPCDYPEAVTAPSMGMWGTMPCQSPLVCPTPIIENTGDQKILVLDMDETLIHASAQELPEVDFKVTDPFGMCASQISVKKRPHVEYFLEQVAKMYKVIVFTAGTKEYATQVLDRLDPNGTLFAHRLFRESCLLVGHLMVKDLRLVTNDLRQVIIVDNTPSAYLLQRENGIHIPSYFGMDREDKELLHLLPLLQTLAEVEDVRPHIVHHATTPRHDPNSSDSVSDTAEMQPPQQCSNAAPHDAVLPSPAAVENQ